MSALGALIPVAPFLVVKIGASGKTYGPFPNERAASTFAASYGTPSSNFVIRVRPPEAAEQQMAGWLAANAVESPEGTQ